MKQIGCLILVMLLFYSCGQEKAAVKQPIHFDSPEVADSIDLSKIVFIVLEFDTANQSHLFPKGATPAKLTRKEIIHSEKLLDKYLEKYNKDGLRRYDSMVVKYPSIIKSGFTIDSKNYGRQFIAATSASGEKLVYVNARCGVESKEDLEPYFLRVDDGGNCYFQAIMNLTKKEVADFQINGN